MNSEILLTVCFNARYFVFLQYIFIFKGLFYLNSEQVDGNTVVCTLGRAARRSNVSDYYTPGIYAEGYIVFVFPFVRWYVRMFVRSFVPSFVLPSVAWNLRQSFALKFLKWCISQQLLIRNHSYLDHSYPGGLAFTP